MNAVSEAAVDLRPWRVFQMNEFEWWMARSAEDAARCYAEIQGCSVEDCKKYELLGEVRELTDAELERQVFVDNECSLEDPTRKRSFADELRRRIKVERPEFPSFFATTEF